MLAFNRSLLERKCILLNVWKALASTILCANSTSAHPGYIALVPNSQKTLHSTVVSLFAYYCCCHVFGVPLPINSCLLYFNHFGPQN